jgi:diguanylate cyclase (GGDEF)-like protein
MGIRLVLALWVALLALAGPAAAQTAKVGDALSTCVARVAPGDTPAAMLVARERFDCDVAQRGLGEGDYWVIARTLPADAGLVPYAVRSASLWQRSLTLHILYADGRDVTQRVGDHGARHILQLGAIFQMPLPVLGQRATTLLWRVDGAASVRGIVLDPRIATPAQTITSNLLFAGLYAAFGGLCLALLVYNLALWTVLRHQFQLFYCAMLLALGGYAVSSSGALAWWIDIGNTERIRINYVLLACAGLAAVAFARRFFEDQVFDRTLDRLGKAACASLATTATVFVVVAPRAYTLLDHAYSASFVLLMVYAVALLWRAWRVRANHLWVFALCWAAPIAFAALRLASQWGILTLGFWLDNSTLLAMAAEALLSSVAISYRLRLLLAERDAAIAGETAARALADRDPLTGLLNRRAFLREAIGASERRTLVLADIDHFKLVNDTLGHDGGDEVLRRFARAFVDAAPPGALVARIGGEEFAILAPDIDPQLCETLLAAVRTAAMPFDLRITASLGSESAVVASESDWSRLYRGADQALFAAKRAGRDRARHAPAVLAA